MENEFEECYVSFEESKAKLEEIELKLAIRLSIFGTTEFIRQSLIVMCKQNTLVEDELVQDWHQAYAGYMDYLEHHEEIR